MTEVKSLTRRTYFGLLSPTNGKKSAVFVPLLYTYSTMFKLLMYIFLGDITTFSSPLFLLFDKRIYFNIGLSTYCIIVVVLNENEMSLDLNATWIYRWFRSKTYSVINYICKKVRANLVDGWWRSVLPKEYGWITIFNFLKFNHVILKIIFHFLDFNIKY